MYWFDTTLLVLLAASALLGAWSGLVGQLARILCLGLSCGAAILLHESVAGFLQECVLMEASPLAIDIVAYVAVFILGYLILYFASRLIREVVREAGLEGYDRLLGAILGAGKMALLLGVVCLGMVNYRHPTTETILEKSKFAKYFADAMEGMVVMIPDDYKVRFREIIGNLRDQTIGDR